MTEEEPSFVDNLRELQGEYIMLNELYEKERNYGQKLALMMKNLQFEVDTAIQISPKSVGDGYRAAYLVSEAVVVVFDVSGKMTTKPLEKYPPEAIVSIVQDCTPSLRRALAEKRREQSERVRNLERVLKEMKRAQATFKQTKRDENEIEAEEPEEEGTEGPPVSVAEPRAAPEPQAEQAQVPPPRQKKEGFVFRGNYGEKQDISVQS